MPYLGSPHYPYQRIAPQANAEGHQPLFPKPIYSYSILIFMALPIERGRQVMEVFSGLRQGAIYGAGGIPSQS